MAVTPPNVKQIVPKLRVITSINSVDIITTNQTGVSIEK